MCMFTPIIKKQWVVCALTSVNEGSLRPYVYSDVLRTKFLHVARLLVDIHRIRTRSDIGWTLYSLSWRKFKRTLLNGGIELVACIQPGSFSSFLHWSLWRKSQKSSNPAWPCLEFAYWNKCPSVSIYLAKSDKK